MKIRLVLSVVALTAGLSITAIAQSQQQDHQEHHPAGSAAQTQPVPPAAPPAAQMPSTPAQPQMPMDMGQMMQRMPQNCMPMMQQMMQGRMGMMSGMQAQPANQSAATKAYMEAAERMHEPMLAGLQTSDPDIAFVRAMIAHHQGAIDMAKVVLQFGKDDQAKKWANDVIREQQREIAEMQQWLKKTAH